MAALRAAAKSTGDAPVALFGSGPKTTITSSNPTFTRIPGVGRGRAGEQGLLGKGDRGSRCPVSFSLAPVHLPRCPTLNGFGVRIQYQSHLTTEVEITLQNEVSRQRGFDFACGFRPKSLFSEKGVNTRLILTQRARRRRAVSELTGVMLSLGVTLAAGVAVWGFARTQAGVQEQQLGAAFNGNVNSLNEQFVVAQVVYAASSITIYFYNSGQAPVQFAQIEVYNSTRTKIDLTYTATKVTDLNHVGTCTVTPPGALESTLLGASQTSFTVNGGTVSSITLTFPACYTGTFKSGFTYFLNVLGRYGNTATYFQAM